MSKEKSDERWALIQGTRYREEISHISSKYRSQIARKVHDLMNNPRPGGSRTPLAGYDGLCRLKCGAWRVIYAYDDKVVQLLTVRQRNEATYDKLDDLEILELEPFRQIEGKTTPSKQKPDWEKIAKDWGKSAGTSADQAPAWLPEKITAAMLRELAIPEEYWTVLTSMETCEDLQDTEDVPHQYLELVLERLFPRSDTPGTPSPVVDMEDLADARARLATGPISAAESSPTTEEAMPTPDPSTERSGLPARISPSLPVASSRWLTPMRPYGGNTQRGIAQDTHYTAKLDGTVRLIYNVGHNERALLTTDAHAELIAMVNEAKRSGGGSDGGRFVINEYRHVLVPTQSGEVLFAGLYTRDLEFEFDGRLISPVAPPDIQPGDLWPGPHVGIRYTLAANASDVRFEQLTPRGTVRRVLLTDCCGDGEAEALLRRIRRFKPGGGALYINEARELFAPVDRGNGYERVYLGHLGRHPWFPEPT